MTQMVIQKVGQWQPAGIKLQFMALFMPEVLRRAVRKEALLWQKEIVKGIRNQAPGGKAWDPASPSEWTLATRRLRGFSGTKSLIHAGDLLRSITLKEERKAKRGSVFFVGVLKTATKTRTVGKKTKTLKLANIGEIHEQGRSKFQIKITKNMMKFLGALFKEMGFEKHKSSGRGYLEVTIPKRPFLRPVADKLSPQVQKRLRMNVGLAIGSNRLPRL